MTTTAPTTQPTARPSSIQPFTILVLGAIVIPVAIALLTNSYETPDAEAYVRMAFGTVAGQTVAIIAALTVVAVPVVRRAPLAVVMPNVVIALVVVSLAAASIGSAMTMLLERLNVAG